MSPSAPPCAASLPLMQFEQLRLPRAICNCVKRRQAKCHAPCTHCSQPVPLYPHTLCPNAACRRKRRTGFKFRVRLSLHVCKVRAVAYTAAAMLHFSSASMPFAAQWNPARDCNRLCRPKPTGLGWPTKRQTTGQTAQSSIRPWQKSQSRTHLPVVV